MPNPETNAKTKKPGMWNRLKLRGRLLAIMLTVALAAVLICAGCFAVTLGSMLQSSREGARALSDNVHRMVEMAFYQQETHIRQIYALSQANLLDRRLGELSGLHQAADWNALAGEAYDLINDTEEYRDPGMLELEGAMVFLLVDGAFYVRGADAQAFSDMAESFYSRLRESGGSPDGTFESDLREIPVGAAYTTGDDGALLAWYPFGQGEYRVGMFVPNTGALRMSEGLRELMDAETGAAVASMTQAARQAALGILLAIVLLLIALPVASRGLAHMVVNPVEREQERQRDLLRLAEEEKAMLKRLDRLKTEFLGNVSHELKTPLTVMSGYAQYSRKTLAGMPEMAEAENRMMLIASEADRLALMVTQILDATRIEEGRMMIDPRPASIAAIIQKTVNTYYPVFSKNNNTLKIGRNAGLPSVLCDEARISQVLVNLISNAARHTRDGVITVSAEAAGSFAVVTVSDTGAGIAPEYLPHLFERFKSGAGQEEGARNKTETGTGLGLYICRHIVETHGGKITLRSAPGEGTAVSFTLPLAQAPSE